MAKVKKQQENTQKRVVFTTELIEKVTQDINNGIIYKGANNPWYNSKEIGVRREGVSFRRSDEETEEYFKCAIDVKYFAETYCKVKREDGTVGNIKLRDYQEEMFDAMDGNRFNIFMCSRQMSKCVISDTEVIINRKNDIKAETLGILYYNTLRKHRRLTIPEKIKLFLYKIINKIK